ncbi:MAG: ATP-binding cassette domain-containing protein [Chitinispirillaceae bacterium]|jgi:oligopeptide/dipeptide ABC transporter ATP-binding protein|nr:ATP-binding cassette domain-containing protein [Chitinispirillaceae bacterium]
MTKHAALTVSNLKVHFPVHSGVFAKVTAAVKAVDGVSFSVERGEVFALVGESGCGKTTTAHAALGLTQPTAGKIELAIGPWKDAPVSWQTLDNKERRTLRRSIQVVFQDPYSSLNPRQTIRAILEEPFKIHGLLDKKGRESRLMELLAQVGLSPEYLDRYPNEFSGGQRQRIGIARALATNPEFIVADEPVSALDVSIQAQVINLLCDLQKTYHLTILFISHDLAVVRHIADRVAVMYLGRIMEMGTQEQIFSSPQHPYTRLLLESVPVPGVGRGRRDIPRKDDTAQARLEKGCLFAPRCHRATAECLAATPQVIDRGHGHLVACVNPF